MSGGLMQLSVYGTQDIYLTGTPQITFFKIVYRRHTNYAVESIEQHFIGDVNFGSESISVIEKIGDLMNRVYLEIDIPKVDLVKNFEKWNVDLETIKKKLEQTKNIYDLLYEYISSNTNIIRQLNALLQTNNISIMDVKKTMRNQNFVGKLLQSKEKLKDGIVANGVFTPIEKNNLIQEIGQFDIITIFHSIVTRFNSEEQSSIIKKEILRFIHNNIYERMRQFYMKVYQIYVSYQNQYQSMVDRTYQERYKFAWVEEIGHAIIDQIELRIGGQIIDKHTGDWLIAFNKLFLNEYQIQNYNRMIGNVSELTNFDGEAKSPYKLIIPFQFWFCRSPGLSLPLIALKYHDIMFTIKLKDLSQVCYIEDSSDLLDIPNVQSQYGINIVSAKIYVDYIFLDADERRRFAQYTHEYLIEIVQYNEFEDINSKQFTANLDFIHPTKFIVWFAQPQYYRSNPTGRNRCEWNNYGTHSDKSGYSMESTYLRINSNNRTDPNLDPSYYNYVQPYLYFDNCPTDGLNIYSFAIKPMEHQPSGTINLGRINDFSIVNSLHDNLINLSETGGFEGSNIGIFMGVYAVSYNILRIINGMAGLAFQNNI